ncbi:hypothetical protein F383_38128 [Gossypium arboreum]|uniref:Uncharacterized protein n=1 Tax=Gossypium arboreum TaxID=29729 RepID=A0A0B0MF33_GOSAR|nr:hypothetical protein F383_38128 [Gossypium arboreum]
MIEPLKEYMCTGFSPNG